MSSKTVHVHIPVESLLSMGDKELQETVSHPDGVTETRKVLQEMLLEGTTCLLIDQSCDNREPNGSCAGHQKD